MAKNLEKKIQEFFEEVKKKASKFDQDMDKVIEKSKPLIPAGQEYQLYELTSKLDQLIYFKDKLDTQIELATFLNLLDAVLRLPNLKAQEQKNLKKLEQEVKPRLQKLLQLNQFRPILKEVRKINPFLEKKFEIVKEVFPELARHYDKIAKDLKSSSPETQPVTQDSQSKVSQQNSRFFEEHLASENDAYFLYAYRQFRKITDKDEITRILETYKLDSKALELRAHSILLDLTKSKDKTSLQKTQLVETSEESAKEWEKYEKLNEDDLRRRVRDIQQLFLDRKIKRQQVEDHKQIEQGGVKGFLLGQKQEQSQKQEDQKEEKTKPQTTGQQLVQNRIQRLYEANALDHRIIRKRLGKHDIQELQRLEKKFGKYKSRDQRALEHFAYQTADKVAFSHAKRGYNAVKQKGSNLIDRVHKNLDAKLENKTGGLATKLKKASNFIRGKRKRENKNIFGAIWDLGKATVNRIIQPIVNAVKTVTKTVSTVVKNAPVIKQAIQGAKWIGNTANAIKSSRAVQAVVKVKNLIGDTVTPVTSFAKGGVKTGALWGGLAAVASLANPALAPVVGIAAGSGFVIGGIRENFSRMAKLNITDFSKARFGMFSNRATEARFYLSNPANVGSEMTGELKKIAEKLPEFQGNQILQTPDGLITPEMAKNVKVLGMNPRKLTNALASLDTFFITSTAATLFGATPAMAALVGVGTSAAHYLLKNTVDNLLMNANKQLLTFLKFPAGSILNIYQGSQSAMRLLGEIAPDRVSMQYVAPMMLPKPIQIVLDIAQSVGIGTSAYTLTDWAVRVAGKNMPFLAKIAPVAAPLLYIATGLLGFHTITLAGLLAATSVGLLSWGIGALAAWATGGNPLIGYAVGAAAYTTLELTLSKKIEGFFDKLFGTIPNGAIGGITNMLNAYNLVKSLMDLIHGRLDSIADYFKAFSILVGLMSGMYLFTNYLESSSQVYQEVRNPQNQSSSIIYQREINTNYYAQSYSLPPKEIDCLQAEQILNLNTDTMVQIDDICDLQSNGTTFRNIRAMDENQKFIIKNISAANDDFEVNMTTNLASILKYCS
jgi:hypothetical protein